MFERKLSALQYDRPSVDVEDQTEFRNIIYWLENMKIGLYPQNARNCLMPNAKDWDKSLEKYLNEVKYPGSRTDKKIIIDWLLNLALRIEMETTREQMNMSKEDISELINLNPESGADFSTVDFNSPEFIKELKELSNMLCVPFYEEEPLVTLRAIAILLCKLRKASRENKQTNQEFKPEGTKKKKIINTVDENVLNMKFKKMSNYDQQLNRCANVLRLLYIKDLRELQTNVNNTIVQLQSVTANPQTDTSLGKVGR